MSDMSSLSHEYASSADFSREINDAVLLLKKKFVGGAKPKTEPPDSDDTILRLRDILASLLERLGGSIDLSAEQEEMAIPEDVLSRIVEEHRGDLAYFREDLKHVVDVLSSPARIGRKEVDVLDSICEAADASASATFRKLWRR